MVRFVILVGYEAPTEYLTKGCNAKPIYFGKIS